MANEHWSYDQAGLTPAGAALLSIAVAAWTGGMGAEMLGGTSATAATATTAATSATLAGSAALGAAANAGFASLAAQAAVAMVNNGGDIGKTLEQLSSTESVKSILIAMGTAGLGTAVSGHGMNAVAVQSATGCVTGEISGSGCEQGAKTAAILSGAGEAYQYLVGYAPSAAPGDNRFGTKLDGSSTHDGSYDPIQSGQFPVYGQQQSADYGMNVVGLNKAGSTLSQGGTISRLLNQIPFINATAGLHDYFFSSNPDLNFTAWNVPTMLPAAAISIPAALNNPNISWITQIKMPQSIQINSRKNLINSEKSQATEGVQH